MPREELLRLDAELGRALKTGDESRLDVLGYGEISTVVAWEAGTARYACKRLPPFGGARQFEAYRKVFEAYLATLRSRGLSPLHSVLETVAHPGRATSAWCIQPIHPAGIMLPTYFQGCSRLDAERLFARLLAQIAGCVDARVGLDGQISNWVLIDGGLFYLDVTTPLLRDEAGTDMVDIGLFTASLPWAVRGLGRPLLQRIVATIVDKYYQPRGVVLDLLGNLYKERLTSLLPAFLEQANANISPPLTAEEVRRYYAGDARTWAMLQRLRRVDRCWQRRVRRRAYPFLLPGRIAR